MRSFFFEIIYAYLIAYLLYWLVVYAEGNDYKLYAIGLYVIYSMINIVQVQATLALILPPLFFFAKTVASLSCAHYAFLIEKAAPSGGFSRLAEDEESPPPPAALAPPPPATPVTSTPAPVAAAPAAAPKPAVADDDIAE